MIGNEEVKFKVERFIDDCNDLRVAVQRGEVSREELLEVIKIIDEQVHLLLDVRKSDTEASPFGLKIPQGTNAFRDIFSKLFGDTFAKAEIPETAEVNSRAKFPHCDDKVLHAPKVCEFCDAYPDWQQKRIDKGINFTGENDSSKLPDPASERRPLETINRWGGNVAVSPTDDKQIANQDYVEKKMSQGLQDFKDTDRFGNLPEFANTAIDEEHSVTCNCEVCREELDELEFNMLCKDSGKSVEICDCGAPGCSDDR